MKILIDASCIGAQPTGLGYYALGLLSGFERVAVQHDISIMAHGGSLARELINDFPFHSRGNRLAKLLRLLPFDIGQVGQHDLYHELNYVPYAFSGKTVTTICDLSCLVYPEYHPAKRVAWFKSFIKRMANSDHIITISQHSKSEIVKYMGVAEEKVAVTYLASSSTFHPIEITGLGKVHLQSRFNLSLPYFLTVGTVEPRKNMLRLLQAYSIFKKKYSDTDIDLAIVGCNGWLNKEIYQYARAHKLESCVKFLGYVSEDDLRLLYNHSHAFVYPSLYEGFGLPPLEAMCCGAPVICSDSSSLPEVVGDAGMLVDTTDVEAIAHALEVSTCDSQLMKRLAVKGRERSAMFSWTNCAKETVNVYEKLL